MGSCRADRNRMLPLEFSRQRIAIVAPRQADIQHHQIESAARQLIAHFGAVTGDLGLVSLFGDIAQQKGTQSGVILDEQDALWWKCCILFWSTPHHVGSSCVPCQRIATARHFGHDLIVSATGPVIARGGARAEDSGSARIARGAKSQKEVSQSVTVAMRFRLRT